MSNTLLGKKVVACPLCYAAIGDKHNVTKCLSCDQELPESTLEFLSKVTGFVYQREGADGDQNAQRGAVGYAHSDDERGSLAGCLVLGSIALVVGAYFLVDPSAGGSNYANAHALTLGQTFMLSGAILIGFALRPR